ncbi:hypothetical protein NCG89_00685 [Spongiibacter taiwanensis]|uniref:hypothetical protein n=1 Tax=Spongiibacter taiwanensis TaxID=1748242 RepID=UPI0020365F74|nr:hypothetical protein [Spongiibacter taiwanensis]USA43318.1 hypothetical protein NCG89_00685 [Spongiibacter taiwanensis]
MAAQKHASCKTPSHSAEAVWRQSPISRSAFLFFFHFVDYTHACSVDQDPREFWPEVFRLLDLAATIPGLKLDRRIADLVERLQPAVDAFDFMECAVVLSEWLMEHEGEV